jgi:hypothetical protein
LGIGTASPSSVLSVKSDINNDVNNGILFEAADSTNKLLQLYENSVGECYMGFYQADVQTALIRTNGSSYFNGGNVGINTSSPDKTLHVVGSDGVTTFSGYGSRDFLVLENNQNCNFQIISNSSNAGNILFSDEGASGRGILKYDHASDFMSFTTAATERMRIDSSGNVGIGVTAPTRALSVFGDTAGVISITSNSTDGISSLSFGDTADDNAGRVNYLNASDDMLFYTAAAERMRIDASGNVGINTASPASIGGGAKLTVDQAADGNIVFARGGSTRQVQLGTTSTTGYINADNTSGGLTFNVNASERMRIDSSGNVDIGSNATASAGLSKQLLSLVNPSGTTSTAARLWMSGTNATTRGAYIEAEVQSTGNDHDLIFATSASGAAPSEAMRIDSSGNVGIGGPNPLEKLFVAGNVFAFGAGSGDGTYGANIQIGKNNGPKISSTQESSDDDVQGLAFFTKSSSVSGDASVERMRIDSSGHAIIPAGVTLGTAVGTYNAANTLDDYEEGTFTPQFNITNATITHDIEQGNYTKVGNTVFFHIVIGTDAASGSFSGSNVLITGMPFAASRSQTGAIGLTHSWASELDDPAWSISAGTTTMSFYKADNAAGLVLGAQFATGGNSNRLDITGCYHTDS